METLENDYALVSKEVLSSLGIKNIFYEFPGGITCLLRPLYLEVGRWICTASAELSVTGFIAVNETKYAVHSERTAGLEGMVQQAEHLAMRQPVRPHYEQHKKQSFHHVRCP